MKKKAYIKPTIIVVEVNVKPQLLAGSGGDIPLTPGPGSGDPF